MHYPSLSSTAASPRCTSAKSERAQVKPPGSRPSSGRSQKQSSSPMTNIFHLTRPLSGTSSRSVVPFVFVDDVKLQREALFPTCAQHTSREPSAPGASRVPSASGTSRLPSASHLLSGDRYSRPPTGNSRARQRVASPQPKQTPPSLQSTNPKGYVDYDVDGDVDGPCWEWNAAAEPPVAGEEEVLDEAQRIFQLMKTHRAMSRRPSKIPTPPPLPPMQDLLGRSPTRRHSTFRAPSFSEPLHTEVPLRDDTRSGGNPLDDEFDVDEEARDEFDDDYPTEGTVSTGNSSAGTGRDSPSLFRPHHDKVKIEFDLYAEPQGKAKGKAARLATESEFQSGHSMMGDSVIIADREAKEKRDFCAQLNALSLIHGGVRLFVPYTPSLPHFQALHPLDLIREATNTEIPLTLRVMTTDNDGGSVTRIAGREGGFLSQKDLKRELKATNFMIPKIHNPGPLELGDYTTPATRPKKKRFV